MYKMRNNSPYCCKKHAFFSVVNCDLFKNFNLSIQIYVSKKWGFTKYEREEFEKLREDGRLANDGCNVRYRPEHGPLDAWRKVQNEIYSI